MAGPRTKAKENRAKSAAKTHSHPTYREMVTEAIFQKYKRGGCSLQVIKTYMEENFDIPENYNVHLKQALAKMVEEGKLEKVTTQSYKFSPSYKKEVSKTMVKKVESESEEEDEAATDSEHSESEQSEEEAEDKKKTKNTTSKSSSSKASAKKTKKEPREPRVFKRGFANKKKAEEESTGPRTRKPLKSTAVVKKKTSADRAKKAKEAARTVRTKKVAASRKK